MNLKKAISMGITTVLLSASLVAPASAATTNASLTNFQNGTKTLLGQDLSSFWSIFRNLSLNNGVQFKFDNNSGKWVLTEKTGTTPATPSTNCKTKPSTTPSTTPTTKPAPAPSTTPTAKPAPAPSTTPTTKPAPAPSTTPTTKPAPAPSTTPTTKPAPAPSTTPTTKPAPAPSTTPTTKPTPAPSQTSSTLNQFEAKVVELVNAERAKEGLKPLVIDATMSKGARAKSQDMADKGYFDHNSPTYGSPFAMMKTFGVSYMTAGENIAAGQSTPEAVVAGWMNSPGHRANIMNGNFGRIGVGFVSANQGYHYYWTQWFAN